MTTMRMLLVTTASGALLAAGLPAQPAPLTATNSSETALAFSGPMWDMNVLSQAPKWTALDRPKASGLKAIFFDGVPYRGRPTRVFAWLGLPGKTDPGRKVPGMVLVHGGGGTAFEEWVQLWTDRGYAAIALDTCGALPVGSYGRWTRHEQGGPPGWGGWDQIDAPRQDQWTYHAVAGAILAHSLLRSLPEVDPERTGLTGISWGGYLACIIAGVDQRFKLAVPVYGCGFTDEHAFAASVQRLGPAGSARWMQWWDPSVYLDDASMPLLWVTGSNDFAYTMNALKKSYRLPKGPRILCVRLRMPHGHGGAGENPKEIHVFAESLLKAGDPLPIITGQGRDGARVWATFECKRPLAKAELNFTKDTGRWQDRKWEAQPAEVGPQHRISATVPAEAKVWYLNLFDDRDCVVSTEHEEL
jgi:dienelactone hydrolase